MHQIAGFEFPAGPDQHIAQPPRLDFLQQRLRGDAEGTADLGLRDQQAATRQLDEAFPEIRVDAGCGGSHVFHPPWVRGAAETR